MDDIEKFKAAVERHMLETGITATGFGKRFAHDPNFVFRLREGREPRRSVRDRILTAMQADRVSA